MLQVCGIVQCIVYPQVLLTLTDSTIDVSHHWRHMIALATSDPTLYALVLDVKYVYFSGLNRRHYVNVQKRQHLWLHELNQGNVICTNIIIYLM